MFSRRHFLDVCVFSDIYVITDIYVFSDIYVMADIYVITNILCHYRHLGPSDIYVIQTFMSFRHLRLWSGDLHYK